MKPKPKSLKLSRETLSLLDSHDLSGVAGGEKWTYPLSFCACPTYPCSGNPVCGDW